MNPNQAPHRPAEPGHFTTTLSPQRRGQRGIAIITVLAVLLLMSVLIVAFFKMAQSELTDARYYSESVRTRQLSEVVTNVVIAQIRQATRTDLGSGKYTWASQPGAITQFHSIFRNGTDYRDMAFKIYKLYSSSSMVAGTQVSENLANDVPGDWDDRPAKYVDLNEPVYNSTQDRLYFPIIDPRGYATEVSEGKINSNNIEGFHYSSVNSRNKQINGVVEPGQGEIKQRLPMPVEWLYMLADGTLGHLDDNGSFIAPEGGSNPTERNPMVARVAFWTDDESAKININVASEGAFWDIPRADTAAERGYGRFQPVRNETYRYPGHVSGISLSTVLFPGSGAKSGVRGGPFLEDGDYQDILKLSPKGRWFPTGSGRGDKEAEPDEGTFTPISVKYLPGEGRLYATVDEMLYQGAKTNGDTSGDTRPLNDLFQQSDRAREFFERGRHSLTVNSNAPEITLFGTPRICLWPMKDIGPVSGTIPISAEQTYYDRLISFASTIGGRRYYWQKRTSSSRHGEIYNNSRGENMQLLDSYMMNLVGAPIPGYGGTFERKYGKGPFKDSREIMIQIWDYMRNTNLNDPLLNPAYHYNDLQSWAGGPNETRSQIGRGQIAGSCLCGGTNPHRSVWWQTFNPFGKGHGRVYTLSEVAMVFYARGASAGSSTVFGDPRATMALSAGEKLVEVGLFLESFSATHGFRSIQPNSRIVVAGGVDTASTNGTLFVARDDYPDYRINDQRFPHMQGTSGRPGVMARWDNEQNYKGKRGWGGHGGVRLFSADLERASGIDLFNAGGLQENDTLAWRTKFNPRSGTNTQETIDRESAIVVDAAAPTMMFKGDRKPLAIVLYDTGRNGDANVNNLIQVFYVKFDHPNPALSGTAFPIPAPTVNPAEPDQWQWHKRIAASGKRPEVLLSADHDVVRSMQVAHGDFRLISGRRVGSEHIWRPHPDFLNPAVKHAHTLTAADGSKLAGFNSSRGYALDESGQPIQYPSRYAPDFTGTPPPAGAFVAGGDESFFPRESRDARGYELSVDPGITGDWDQGIGGHIDGAYVNRPEDGTRTGLRGSSSGSGIPYFDNLDKVDEVHKTFFAPNRVVTSAGQLGSIPTGIQAEIPWRTLLFRPDPEHFGARNYPRIGDPPDHVMMDWFWMPLVEPFPISQPFATMGKVNMNYRIVPFDYIKRQTAMHAVMKDQRMMAVENGQVGTYKEEGGPDFRYPIDIPTTLLQFEDRFDRGEVFRSATEICEIYMIPRGASESPSDRNTLGTPRRGSVGSMGYDYPPMRDFWKKHALTGDNVKERTYTNLYPRLTTKSNVYQTHMIVESIEKVRSVAHDVFDPEKDKITGRWRGSAIIERNIDPSKIRPGNGSIPDYFQDPKFNILPSMEKFYQYRVLHVKQFNP